jgi:hypothetical protein
VEHLLRGAAGWAPDEPEPGFLTAGGVALLLAEDVARRRRRTVRARVATFAGFFAGAAACSATLVMALTGPLAPPRSAGGPPTKPVQVAQTPGAEAEVTAPETSGQAEQVSPVPVRARRPLRVRRHGKRVRRPARTEPAVPVWTDETVERQVAGVIAQAWLVEPQEDGGYQLTPALVNLPVDPAAVSCFPDEGAAAVDVIAAPSPAPDGAPRDEPDPQEAPGAGSP